MKSREDRKSGKLVPRTAPKQSRAKETVQNILTVTRTLLIEEGVEKLTTNHVAKAAEMNISTLYRYFPNKQAILFEMYRQFLEKVEAILQPFVLKAAGTDFDALLDEIFFDLYDSSLIDSDQQKYESELAKAMRLFPELEAVDREHHKWVGQTFAAIFREAGLTCDEETSYQIGLYIYCLDLILPEFSSLGGDQKLAFDWYRQTINHIVSPYRPDMDQRS